MTYRRDPDSFAAAWTRIRHAVGPSRLAAICRCTDWRVQQLSNPMRGDEALERAVAADLAAHAAGEGTPIFDVYRCRLAARSAVRDISPAAGSEILRRLAPLLRKALALIEAAPAEAKAVAA